MSTEEFEELKLISAPEAARLLSVSTNRLYEWRRDGVGPRYVKTSESQNSKILYPYKALLEWIKDHSVTPTKGK